MGKKQARIDELEAQVEELKKNELKILAEWSDSIGRVRVFIPPAAPLSDPADKKIIENQKQAILELHKQVDVLADQRNNAIDRAERAEAKSDGWSDAYTNQVGALHEQCDQLRDELAELKANPEPDLVEGHDAKFWFGRWEKQLNHNEQLQAVNSGRRVKMQRLEKEVKDACKDTQYWQDKYAVLAASINEVPDEPSPPTRPDEPPVGLIFRVDRTGELYLRMHEGNNNYGYVSLLGDREGYLCTWTDITDHGDTITRLLLVEATDD